MVAVPSQIAWLDASSEEQRRMRDIIQLFTDREARDELGLGTIRDALGDMLFPGTSTLHTRARYLLIVPWIYQLAATERNPVRKADELERGLAEAFEGTGDVEGLLGAQVGRLLKTLPSEVYWAALGRYGIRLDGAKTREGALLTPAVAALSLEPNEDPALDRVWHGGLPQPPEGFPRTVRGGFAMRWTEANWLRERFVSEAQGTLLDHFVHIAPTGDTAFPWDDPATPVLTGELRDQLDHARVFSGVMHGAQLLYNLMIAQRYEEAGNEGVESPVERYTADFQEWADAVNPDEVRDWDVERTFGLAREQRSREVPPQTQKFVRNWSTFVRRHEPAVLPNLPEAQDLIVRREKETKGKNGRLNSAKRLAAWGGASGAARLNYRWPNVRRLLNDLHAGLAREVEVSA